MKLILAMGGGLAAAMLTLAACVGPLAIPGRTDALRTVTASGTGISAAQTQVATVIPGVQTQLATVIPGVQTQLATALPVIQTQAANAAATATAAARR
ncbi:MAG: hypothetical protein KatS3mg060_0554 [Dehalococcoidia bacterium]|jgi:hypothetical protein|nr:MAG: hypothetical protein KatS3mg060_0554 [Dehalococcoidia bacterium]